MNEESSTEQNGVKTLSHGLIAVAAFILLFVTSVAVIMDSRYTGQISQKKSQVASVIESEQSPYPNLSLTATAAIVMDLTDNKVLYALNPDIQLPLASLTKVPLVLAVSDALSPETIITIPYDTAPSGSLERLVKGGRWKLQDIVDFTLVASSNEGAEILANAANDSIRNKYPDAPENLATIWRMNSIAQGLGLNRTYFLNVSGLDISPTLSGAYGSARDIAALFAYAAASEHLSLFSKTASDGIVLTSVDGRSKARAYNTNEALGQIAGLKMGKTGLTDLAGGNLAVVFDSGSERPVVAVVLGSTREGRFSDIRQLVATTIANSSAQKEVLARKTD
jgi:D-alanyl-D-alanine carboxypeptidase